MKMTFVELLRELKSIGWELESTSPTYRFRSCGYNFIEFDTEKIYFEENHIKFQVDLESCKYIEDDFGYYIVVDLDGINLKIDLCDY